MSHSEESTYWVDGKFVKESELQGKKPKKGAPKRSKKKRNTPGRQRLDRCGSCGRTGGANENKDIKRDFVNASEERRLSDWRAGVFRAKLMELGVDTLKLLERDQRRLDRGGDELPATG